MKKIILSILSIAGIISLYSCREMDEEQSVDMQIQSKQSSMNETYKESDSTNSTVLTGGVKPGDIVEPDPPPKDGGQWRSK